MEGDTIIEHQHKSAIIALVERVGKCTIVLKPNGRKAVDIENSLNQWLSPLPTNLFKSIIFNCGKEFSNWKAVSNQQDIDIYFADPGTPSQRSLNEHSNELLSLTKKMDFNPLTQDYISKAIMKKQHS